ncbi:MAG: hypothetical protein ACE5PO_04470 [Candidatus Bathyarchaeia archaeon]
MERLVVMLEDVDNIDLGGRGRLDLRLELVGVLKGLEDLEGSVVFLSSEARRVLDHAFLEVRRRASVRYVV